MGEVVVLHSVYYKWWIDGGCFAVFLWHVPFQKDRVIIQGVSACILSTRLYRNMWEHVQKTDFKNEIELQWHHNSELVMALISAKICSSMIKMPIIYDDVVIICPRDLVVLDNRGTKGLVWIKNSSENQYQTSTVTYSNNILNLSKICTYY